MDKRRILNSHALKKRFVKDNNLPITVYEEPYFEERLLAIDCLFDSVAKWKLFCEEVSKFDSEEDYFAYYNSIKDAAIQNIQSSEGFIAFGNTVIPKPKESYSHKNLYIEENWYKSFISIDMRRANFSALQLYDAKIFNDASEWEDFLGQFTGMEHILHSKYIRQVIMGACNPKRQIQYETWLMTSLYEFLKNQVRNIQLYSLNVDEIILVHPCEYSSKEEAEHIVREINRVLQHHVVGMRTKMSEFYLEPLAYYGFVKIDINNTDAFEFKCVDAEMFHQHVKLYKGLTITDNDLVFYHNGELAKFLKPIPNYLNPIASS